MPAIIMTPALQFDDLPTLMEALSSLKAAGVIADKLALEHLPINMIPEWVEIEQGGWLLRLRDDQFDEGMDVVGELMGL